MKGLILLVLVNTNASNYCRAKLCHLGKLRRQINSYRGRGGVATRHGGADIECSCGKYHEEGCVRDIHCAFRQIRFEKEYFDDSDKTLMVSCKFLFVDD